MQLDIFLSSLEMSKIDIKERYVRSILGPFWITLSTALTILCLGVVFSFLFKENLSNFFPYLAIGLIFWNYINSSLIEACSIARDNRQNLKAFKKKHDFYIFRHVIKQTIIMFHNLIVIFIILVYFKINITIEFIYLPISLFVLFIYLFFLSKILFYVTARFNDLEQMMISFLTFSFYLTPIIWKKEFLSGYESLLNLNPFYHLIHIFRSLILNEEGYLNSLIFCLISVFILFLISKIVTKKMENQIIFWS